MCKEDDAQVVVNESWLSESCTHMAKASQEDAAEYITAVRGVEAGDRLKMGAYGAIHRLMTETLEEAFNDVDLRTLKRFFRSDVGKRWSGVVMQITTGEGELVNARVAVLSETMSAIVESAQQKNLH